MGYEIIMNDKHIIGTLGQDNKIQYDKDKVQSVIKEMIAGQPGKSGGFITNVKVAYRWDRSRKTNNDVMFNTWKENPLMKRRITNLNALTFGRGFKFTYDASIHDIIKRFWRINNLEDKLNAISTDGQLYGEIFLGLFPQSTGDVLVGIYESSQVDIDFDPSNVWQVNRYIVAYRDEESGKDEQFDMMPIETYLSNIELSTSIVSGALKKARKALGLKGATGVKGKGVMVHIKFNNASSEVHGTSDFKQVYNTLYNYMDFISDRLTIHQMYGSPSYDITIDTDDPNVIMNRIEELAGFTIGSNPVHNKSEEWKPLEFRNTNTSPDGDTKELRGLLCAGMDMPEHLLFNQSEGSDESTFSLNKLAEDRQDAYGRAFTKMHKFAVAIAGGNPLLVDEGQLIFPEISTMSEKTKAETYVLKVGAQICSRKTAAMNTGHNWDIEEEQIFAEQEMFGGLTASNIAGAIGGRFSSRVNNQDPDRDDGSDDKSARLNAQNKSTQVMGSRKTND